MPLNIKGSKIVFFLLFEKRTSTACLVIVGLNSNFHWIDQRVIASKSFISSADEVELTIRKMNVTSAKIRISDETTLIKSLMYNKKRIVPSIEP
jgi:hypothetical protein